MSNQEQVFYKVQRWSEKAQSFSFYVQNDFKALLSDGEITKEDLNDAYKSFLFSWAAFMAEAEAIEEDIISCFKEA